MPYIIDSSKPSGTIEAYGGAAAPDGFLLCDGASLLRASYPALFAAIGTAYGAADGTHFNVPDMRGKFLRGVDGTANVDPDKAGRTASATGGNTGNAVGSVQGDQIVSHTHNVNLYGDGASNGQAQRTAGSPFGSVATTAAGGNETRPKNVYVNYIIKI